MAQFSYESYTQRQQQKQFEGGEIKFFNFLKNDGDVVLVRFPYKTPNEFELFDLHKVNVNGNYRFVNCIREANQPTTSCPLCAKGDVAKGRFIVKMVVYVQGDNGIQMIPCVWDRPQGFAKVLAERITDYPNAVFKIKRIGAKGDMKTTYDVMPTNPQVYNEQLYPIDFSAFTTFKPNNFAFMDRSYDDLVQFVNTGVMPERQKAQQPQQVNEGYVQPQVQPIPQTYGTQPQYQQPQGQYQAPQQNYGVPQGYGQPQMQPNYPQAEANPFPQNVAPQQPTQQQPVEQNKPNNRRYY